MMMDIGPQYKLDDLFKGGGALAGMGKAVNDKLSVPKQAQIGRVIPHTKQARYRVVYPQYKKPREQAEWRHAMSGNTDIAKGRIKEAAGVMTGNDRLREKGKQDQAIGRVRKTSSKALEKAVEKMRK